MVRDIKTLRYADGAESSMVTGFCRLPLYISTSSVFAVQHESSRMNLNNWSVVRFFAFYNVRFLLFRIFTAIAGSKPRAETTVGWRETDMPMWLQCVDPLASFEIYPSPSDGYNHFRLGRTLCFEAGHRMPKMHKYGRKSRTFVNGHRKEDTGNQFRGHLIH